MNHRNLCLRALPCSSKRTRSLVVIVASAVATLATMGCTDGSDGGGNKDKPAHNTDESRGKQGQKEENPSGQDKGFDILDRTLSLKDLVFVSSVTSMNWPAIPLHNEFRAETAPDSVVGFRFETGKAAQIEILSYLTSFRCERDSDGSLKPDFALYSLNDDDSLKTRLATLDSSSKTKLEPGSYAVTLALPLGAQCYNVAMGFEASLKLLAPLPPGPTPTAGPRPTPTSRPGPSPTPTAAPTVTPSPGPTPPSRDSLLVRLTLPDDLLRNDTVTVLFGCTRKDGRIANLKFSKDELAQGIREKSLSTIEQEMSSCSSSVTIDWHPFQRSDSDRPLWAPFDFKVIEAKYTEPRGVVEVGLGDWKVSELSVSVSREAFDKRKAREAIINIAADNYNFQWPDNLVDVKEEAAPVSYKGRILYKSQPSFKVSTTWLADELVQEEFVTQKFDIKVE